MTVKAMAMSAIANVGIASAMILNSSEVRKESLVGESLYEGERGEGGDGGGGSGLFSFLSKASLSLMTKLMAGMWRLSVGTCRSVCLM